MSLRAPRPSSHGRVPDGMSELGRALAADAAEMLGRLGGAVEASLARLADAAAHGNAEQQVDAQYDAAAAVWVYFVQREAMGLRQHAPVIEMYGIPASVLAKVGAARPAPRT